MSSDFSLATHETGKQWDNVCAVLEENFFQYRFFAHPSYQSSRGVNKDIFKMFISQETFLKKLSDDMFHQSKEVNQEFKK